jgi:peptide/nickel transport system substrate-binding protein
VLDAYADYWGDAPGVQTLRFRDIPELSARVTALTTGEIDFTYQLPPDQLASLEGNADLSITSKPSYRYYFIWLNAQTEAFGDVRVRQAMIHALDIPTIKDALMQDTAELMDSPIPSTVFGYAPQTPYAYDPEKAKQLLAEAGYENGFETDMIWAPGSSPQDREIAQAMLSYWNAVGITVNDRQSERAQWLEALLALDWDMDFQTNGVITGDADFVLRRLYHSTANRTGYANPDLDKILDDAAASVDQEERKELYAQACKLIWDEAVGIYPFTLVQAFIARSNVQGFVPTASFPVFTNVSV